MVHPGTGKVKEKRNKLAKNLKDCREKINWRLFIHQLIKLK
jgi:hypothetical protein